MSIFDIFRRQQKESSTAAAMLGIVTPGQPIWRTDGKFESYAKEGYRGNPYVYAAVSYIAKSAAGVPWQVKRTGTTDTEERVIDQHPLLALLRRPNPYEGRARFVEGLLSYLLVGGDAYVERVGPNDLRRPPQELYTLRPDRMKVIPGNALQRVGGYVYEAGSTKRQFEAQEVLHLRCFDPLSDWYGMSPMQAGSKSVDQNNDSRAWNTSMLQNGARLSGAFLTEGDLTDTAFTRLKSEMENQHSGSGRVGKFLLLEGGLKWQEMSLSPKDMDWLEGEKLSAREIAICYSVPPELIGDSANKTYSNYQEARKAFYQETVLPLLDYLRDELNNWLVPLYGGSIYLDYNSDEIEALQEDRDRLYARAGQAYTAGLLTRNEARQLVGMPDDTTDPTSNEFRAAANPLSFGDPNAPKSACTCGRDHKSAIVRHLTAKQLSMKHLMSNYFGEQRDAAIKALEEHYGA